MKFKDIFKVLEKNKYYVFSFEDLLCFYSSVPNSSLKQLLHRWSKKNWISSLRKGIYELTYPHSFNIPDMYIANRLYTPSYVSLETALSHYSLIPEIAMAVTSVSVKPTRRFRNNHGLFVYRTIRHDCFTGYRIEKIGGYEILIAEPEKALVDYLYFKTYRSRKIDLKSERLDITLVAQLNKKKIDYYGCKFKLDLKRFLYAYL